MWPVIPIAIGIGLWLFGCERERSKDKPREEKKTPATPDKYEPVDNRFDKFKWHMGSKF